MLACSEFSHVFVPPGEEAEQAVILYETDDRLRLVLSSAYRVISSPELVVTIEVAYEDHVYFSPCCVAERRHLGMQHLLVFPVHVY